MRLLATLTVIALGVAAPAMAQPTMKGAHLNWKVPPSVREMARRFPAEAKQHEITKATVAVDCLSNAFGNLTCEATDASPADHGFAEAAVGVMSRARVNSTDEKSPEGRRFSYRLWFGAWSPEERAAVKSASTVAVAPATAVAAN